MMKRTRRISLKVFGILVLTGAAYMAGRAQLFEPQPAQGQVGLQKKDPTEERIKKAHLELKSIQDELARSGKYRPVINGVNSFAVLCGGLDVAGDLQAGRGVDPVSFAGLYAGQATNEIAAKLKKNNKGQLMYDTTVIRLYSRERLKKLWQRRDEIAELTTATPGTTKPRP